MNVKRTYYSGGWTFGTAATTDFWKYYTFTLGQLPSASEFTSVFDEYRIKAIKVTFRPNLDAVVGLNRDINTATTDQNSVSYLHTCIDPMSTVVPAGVYGQTTINTFLENSGVKTRRVNRAVSVYLKPTILDGVEGGGTATAKVSRNTWIRTSETAVVYRGFHALWQAFSISSVVPPAFNVFVTYYMQFKNLR